MIITETTLAGAHEITLDPHGDHRGYFMRTYDRTLFDAHGLQTQWVQENQSMSMQVHTIRGLHFQRPPHSETKLVRVLVGRILDVIVDLRAGSPTFGQHLTIELSAANQKCLYVPRGCAHGFCLLEAPSIVHYKVDNPYAPEAEGGLRWSDPLLGIAWPTTSPIISAKDDRWPSLSLIRPIEI
jgi:dTDP-4-dehydrorhamnose 3,5-epimerase